MILAYILKNTYLYIRIFSLLRKSFFTVFLKKNIIYILLFIIIYLYFPLPVSTALCENESIIENIDNNPEKDLEDTEYEDIKKFLIIGTISIVLLLGLFFFYNSGGFDSFLGPRTNNEEINSTDFEIHWTPEKLERYYGEGGYYDQMMQEDLEDFKRTIEREAKRDEITPEMKKWVDEVFKNHVLEHKLVKVKSGPYKGNIYKILHGYYINIKKNK